MNENLRKAVEAYRLDLKEGMERVKAEGHEEAIAQMVSVSDQIVAAYKEEAKERYGADATSDNFLAGMIMAASYLARVGVEEDNVLIKIISDVHAMSIAHLVMAIADTIQGEDDDARGDERI